MHEFTTQVLFRPDTAAQRFLPEGPYPCGYGKLSWVAIQHGAESTAGSLNLLDLSQRTNETFDLPGRPGFAFPTNGDGIFLIGMERRLGLFDSRSGTWQTLSDDIERDVSGTIINDGVVYSGGVIFGAKDLKFSEPKAGLYLWRRSDQRCIRLRADQICSNGKVVFERGAEISLLDIDSPKKTVVRYTLDTIAACLSEPETLIDLRAGSVFPDGMVATPDGSGVIIAFYNPQDAQFGEARQYSLSGELQAVWKTAGSPRVTCPQLIRLQGRVKLVLTTADEGLSPEQQARHPNAGCLFIGDTNFSGLPETPVFQIP